MILKSDVRDILVIIFFTLLKTSRQETRRGLKDIRLDFLYG